MKNKLTLEQVTAIPEKLKTLTVKEIATEYLVQEQTIRYWIKQLKKRGVEVSIVISRRSLLDK